MTATAEPTEPRLAFPEAVAKQGDAMHPGITVAALARRLGVAPATLRTWDRRYGLGSSDHEAGSHRRYSEADVARLVLMRRLVNTGVPPGAAARTALAAPVDQDDRGVEVDARTQIGAGSLAPIARPAAVVVRGLTQASRSLDAATCSEIVCESIDARGVVWTWEHVLIPVMVEVGRLWESTGRGVEVEHLLSESVIAALSAVSLVRRKVINARPVLLACAELETHSLPLVALGAALAEKNVGVRVLGGRVPPSALISAIQRVGPSAVLLWSSSERTGQPHLLENLPDQRPAPLLLAAGPGWVDPVPTGVVRVTDFAGALDRLVEVARA
ncbi:MAG: MerR family transcriptional regulator [Actinobacteria bacterium]|nr:MerR family transcriptional regulator [Actinomycetota bacterium]MSW36845.1 MerR family transcriptional regulator [Actinomycetota bacterium]